VPKNVQKSLSKRSEDKKIITIYTKFVKSNFTRRGEINIRGSEATEVINFSEAL